MKIRSDKDMDMEKIRQDFPLFEAGFKGKPHTRRYPVPVLYQNE